MLTQVTSHYIPISLTEVTSYHIMRYCKVAGEVFGPSLFLSSPVTNGLNFLEIFLKTERENTRKTSSMYYIFQIQNK